MANCADPDQVASSEANWSDLHCLQSRTYLGSAGLGLINPIMLDLIWDMPWVKISSEATDFTWFPSHFFLLGTIRLKNHDCFNSSKQKVLSIISNINKMFFSIFFSIEIELDTSTFQLFSYFEEMPSLILQNNNQKTVEHCQQICKFERRNIRYLPVVLGQTGQSPMGNNISYMSRPLFRMVTILTVAPTQPPPPLIYSPYKMNQCKII